MKRSLLMGFLAATMSFTSLSYADFTFHSSSQNACEAISGPWSGSGKAYNWFIGECKYHGSGVASALDETGRFTVEVNATKDSGNFLCPAQATEKLIGICADGNAVIITQYGNLTGSFSQNAGNAGGTLSVSPGMNAEVSIQFFREE